MKSLADSIHAAFAKRTWSQEERDSIEDVLDAAAAFAAFELPLAEAARAGVMANREGPAGGASFAKVRAVLATSPRDPRRQDLMTMLDIMVRAQPVVITKFGIFERSELLSQQINERPRREDDERKATA